MASLAEVGLSANVGVSAHETFEDRTPVLAIHYNSSSIITRWSRRATVYGIEPGNGLPQDEFVHLDEPVGSTTDFKNPTYRNTTPPFSHELAYTLATKNDHTVIWETPEEAHIADRVVLDRLIESKKGEYRLPTHIVVGKEAVSSFLVSALNTLAIKGDYPMGEDNDGVFLVDDDMVASRLIQLADLSGVDIKGRIPANHVDRALREVVTTTLISKYFWLCLEDNIGELSGRWHVGCMNFARAYGIEPGEVADLAIMLDDTIRPAAEARGSKSENFPPLNYRGAEKMAEYILQGAK